MAYTVTLSSAQPGRILHGQVCRQSRGLWWMSLSAYCGPQSDCLLLQDIRWNDLGHAAKRPHLLSLRNKCFSGQRCLAVPLQSRPQSSNPPLCRRFRDQRGYLSSATCDVQTLRRERWEMEWPSAQSFYLPTWNFYFTQACYHRRCRF